jgi:acyl-CoA synthetase (AMP-forming)/AMP-acid ligase II
MQLNSIVEILQQKAIADPEAVAYIFLEDGENKEVKLTYGELDRQAKAIAAKLQSIVKPGSRALLVYGYNDALEFIAAFMGCLYAGVVAVPCHPPMNRLTVNEVQTRLVDAAAEIVLSNSSLLTKLKKQLLELGEQNLHWLDTQKILNDTSPTNYHFPSIKGETLAFLQYTSGSTGEPKGVMITHHCLLQNQEMLRLAFGHDHNSVGVGWLPLFHDMGLIGNVLQPIYLGICCVLLSPIAFVQKPIRWLQAISKYRATTSGAPNFAYDLLCDRLNSVNHNLDLSSWQVAFCGAEPVQSSTIERFSQAFAIYGFQKSAFYPCYGMAEATLMITGGDYRQVPTIKYLDKLALEKNQVAIADLNNNAAIALVSAGYPWLDGKLAIVNPQTCQECQGNEVGEIWFSGSSIGQGYWQNPTATQQTFQTKLNDQQFLRTGDLGFIAENELYITGRLNDVLVFWGLNHYPQQIEQTVAQAHPALKANSSAAFSVSIKGQDRLVIVQEIKRNYRQSFVMEDIVQAIRWAIFQQHLIDVYSIVLLTPGALPKTSSGKVQRSTCKTKFLEQSLSTIAQWSLPDSQRSDITSLMERYTNPLTYLNMVVAITKGKLKHLLFYLVTSVRVQKEIN